MMLIENMQGSLSKIKENFDMKEYIEQCGDLLVEQYEEK